MNTLNTQNIDINLVPPNIERDAPLGVDWLSGNTGRDTLKLMGVTDEYNKPSTLEEEKDRVKGFIDNTNQLNWMIQFKGNIVGSVWVDLKDSEYLPSPSVHIMIGDQSSRGNGVGTSSCKAVIEYLKNEKDYKKIYSRYLLLNSGSERLLTNLGFEKLGNIYADSDGLEWQNALLQLK
jgi:RimJ/RimL family protein N-acetyltransferase